MIKFQCCHCDQPIEAPDELLHAEIDCPGCLKKVKVLPMRQPTEPANHPSVKNVARAESESIRIGAIIFTVLAGVFAFAGVVLAGLSIAAVKSGRDAGSGFWICGALIGAALWFYLIAQIVHIRALLAKK